MLKSAFFHPDLITAKLDMEVCVKKMKFPKLLNNPKVNSTFSRKILKSGIYILIWVFREGGINEVTESGGNGIRNIKYIWKGNWNL